ncbi:unnamed protein product [Ostreobium quekettii]|uniref:Uncharacterized protein n=1 Tax=Ostreobium quekettii TaxID=121088 RepID=A0A8S1ILG4_9CHLO|nr:unnamed protein product [Ostreobium quekettii]|eukprot:evm.model.scf_253EXC.2 EVM.evm.TU.scf_253EXC.2   scf_253EXC:3336-7510(-)
MARNLQDSGQFSRLSVWNRSASKCDELAKGGAVVAASPAEVVRQSDITFGMLADPQAASDVVFREGGVLDGLSGKKGYIDMSTVDEATSKKISEAVVSRGGRFLEAPVAGSKKPAIDGTLVILAAGDKSLYEEALPAFEIMGKKSFLLGDVGTGANMKLVINMIMGSMLGALCEGCALAEAGGLSQEDLLEILNISAMASPLVKVAGASILAREYPPAFPLKHAQKDMRLAIATGDRLNQPLPIAAAANEKFKEAKAMNHADDNFTAIYEATTVNHRNK